MERDGANLDRRFGARPIGEFLRMWICVKNHASLFFAAHPNRDPALYGGTNTIATGAGQASYLLLPLISSKH